MRHPPLSLCLFDIGRVLIDFDFRIAADRLSPLCHLSPEEILTRLASWEGVSELEEGRTGNTAFFETIRQRLQFPLSYEAFLPIWTEIFTENKEVTALVRKLLGKIPIALISNTNQIHFEYCRKTFPIIREIRQYVLSYEVGARKPDERIYQAALSRFNRRPEETLYVDDLKELVEAGKTFGLEALQFQGAVSLEEALRQRGLL